MSSIVNATKGLEGVTAVNSSVCYIDGDQGVLAYRGIDIHELADNSTFEECCYLLWFGHLPTRAQLQELKLNLARERKLDASIISLLNQAPKHALPMDVLRTIVSALSFYDPEEKVNDAEANLRKSIRLTSQIAYVVAAYDRIRKGRPIIEPDRTLSHAANFLYQLNGEVPSATAERALDIALILHADHELNASTFAARVVAATLSDMHSAITAAIGALKGPLHGGANEAVFRILEAIDSSGADPVDYVKGMLAQKKKIPGFGHRVYHTEDPRATHLRTMSRDLGNSSGIRQVVRNLAQDRRICSGRAQSSTPTSTSIRRRPITRLGIDIDLFTPVFAVSRISGWTAHVMEQLSDNRLIRPRAEYQGPIYPNKYVAMEQQIALQIARWEARVTRRGFFFARKRALQRTMLFRILLHPAGI